MKSLCKIINIIGYLSQGQIFNYLILSLLFTKFSSSYHHHSRTSISENDFSGPSSSIFMTSDSEESDSVWNSDEKIIRNYRKNDKNEKDSRLEDPLNKIEDESMMRQRTKRYPPHLEPNIMAMGAKFWIRSGECPKSADGDKKFFCPYPNSIGRYSCVETWELCDGVKNCPDASDENPVQCLFYKATQAQFQQIYATQSQNANSGSNKHSNNEIESRQKDAIRSLYNRY